MFRILMDMEVLIAFGLQLPNFQKMQTGNCGILATIRGMVNRQAINFKLRVLFPVAIIPGTFSVGLVRPSHGGINWMVQK